jgi:hypothetical protein
MPRLLVPVLLLLLLLLLPKASAADAEFSTANYIGQKNGQPIS